MHGNRMTLRRARRMGRGIAAFAIGLAHAGCIGSSPPERDSPRFELVEELPAEGSFPWIMSSNAAHTAWMCRLQGVKDIRIGKMVQLRAARVHLTPWARPTGFV